MYPPDEADALRDALALIDADHRGDGEAMAAILKYGNPERICAYLAKIAADLVADLASWHEAPVPQLLTMQRECWLSDDGDG